MKPTTTVAEIAAKCPVTKWVKIPVQACGGWGERTITVQEWLGEQMENTGLLNEDRRIQIGLMVTNEVAPARMLEVFKVWADTPERWPQHWGRAIRPRGKSTLRSYQRINSEIRGRNPTFIIFDELAPISTGQAASKPHDQEYARMLKNNQSYTIASARRERLTRRMEAWGWVFAFAILAGAAVAVTVL